MAGCVTTDIGDEVPADNFIYQASRTAQQDSQAPFLSFAGEVVLGEGGGVFPIEGAWKENGSAFHLQVIDTLGVQYAYVIVQNHELHIKYADGALSDSKNWKNFLRFLRVLGAQQLKSIFCGSYAFLPDLDNGMAGPIFYDGSAQQDPSCEKSFITRTALLVESDGKAQDFPLKNKICQTGKDALSIKTKIAYGVPGFRSELTILWQGAFSSPLSPHVRTLQIQDEQSTYEIRLAR